MKTKIFLLILLMGNSISFYAQSVVSDVVAKNDDNYSFINISRSYTWQEFNSKSAAYPLMVYVNDQPMFEIPSQSRVSLKVFSQGPITFYVKYVPGPKVKEKKKAAVERVIAKYYHSGPPVTIDASHGKTYFLNIDMKDHTKMLIDVTAQLVSIPESESMFNEEDRFKKNPEIKIVQEDKDNPYIKK
jgi:hypothetical protein